MFQYTFSKGFLVKVAGGIVFALPLVMHMLPVGWENVTLGAVFTFVIHWLEDKTLV